MGTCLRIIRGPMISMKIRFPLERSRRERQSLSSARSSGGSRSVRIKNADHHTLSERHDRHFESDLVSDAVSSQHTGAGRRDHSARKDCAQKDALVMEHPEIFYPSALTRKKKYNAARLCPDGRTDQ